MIEITQTLTEEDYAAAADVHFRKHRVVRYRLFVAILMFVNGTFLLACTPLIALGVVSILLGIYILFTRRLLISRVVKSVAKSKRFGEEIHAAIDDEERRFRSEQGGDLTELQLSGLYAFIRHPIGFLFYPQENFFYLLKADAFESQEQMDALQELLEEVGVKELKK